MNCQHAEIKTICTRGFSGPVGDPQDQNPAAHGGITDTDECVTCGARREENINGLHVETGMWGPSRATRIAEVQRLLSSSPKPPAPVTLRRGGLAVVASVGSDGMIDLEGSPDRDDRAVIAALPDEWMARAVEIRQHVQRVADARANV